MLSISYLKSILKWDGQNSSGLPFLTNDNQFIESAAGYDGIIELIQNKGLQTALVLEQHQVGEFSVRPGGFISTSQSIWIMSMVGFNQSRSEIQHECFLRAKKILSMLIAHADDEQLSQWEWNRIPYGARNAGQNMTGYEITLYFNEDLNLVNPADNE